MGRTDMLQDRVTDIMTRRGGYPMFSLATLLLGVSGVYGMLARLRRYLYRQGILPALELPCPVISVGNLTAGGTGKTPLVVHLAELIGMLGYRAAILSRGYKGRCEKSGAVVSDGHTLLCDARHAGDEPFLMASLLPSMPVVVGRNRYAAGMQAVRRFKPDLVVLDDGFQHLRLKRDLNIVLLDAQNPFGNGYLLPRGILREPMGALDCADALILTRAHQKGFDSHARLTRRAHPRPVFTCSHATVVRGRVAAQCPLGELNLDGDAAVDLKGRNAFAFSGLGSNQAFFDTVVQSGARLGGRLAFADHHAYSFEDIDRIAQTAGRTGADLLVTTDKDFVRLPPEAKFPLELIVMGVHLDFGEQKTGWQQYITGQIQDLVKR